MKYLTKHLTEAAYEATASNLAKPHVALTADDNKVHYMPNTPSPTPSHDYVDLGLPSGTKWATMNVGATSVTDYGNYYQYGKGAATYQETSGDTTYEGVEDPLAASADTAVQVWGGQWHMPTKTQFEELTANTTYEWTTIDGINGGKFTAQNGNYVFFPSGGYYSSGSINDVGINCFVWSSTPTPYGDAYGLYLVDSDRYLDDECGFHYGFTVRPVMSA